MTLEIIIPLRNPTEVLDKSIESLVAQTDRNFSVLISDNHSTKGQEHIARAIDRLARSGLPVRKIKPPMELERVEHWNWAHYQSNGDWLKPLFVGDWLEPEYMATVSREMKMNLQCHYIYANFLSHRKKTMIDAGCEHGMNVLAAGSEIDATWAERFFTAGEMRKKILSGIVQSGPPSVAAYRRDVFIAMGGYRTTLPICADSLLFSTIAARFGGLGIARPLGHFYLHDTRFSQSLPVRKTDVFRERIIFLTALIYHAFTEKAPISRWNILRMMFFEIRQRLFGKLHLFTP